MKENRRSRRQAFLCAAVVVAAVSSVIAAAQSNPGGWSKAGDQPADYDMGLDRTNAFTGGSSGYIRSNKPDPKGFGTYMQTFDAMEYRGKRLRFSAYVKSENVDNWAGLWMRVDRDKKPVAFDNMYDRAIRDTQGWTQHAIVLDVDSKASAVAFGILLAGKGTVWIDDVTFEVVGEEVPVTDLTIKSKLTGSPRNLDFETGPERR
jgi:hypothetical protein